MIKVRDKKGNYIEGIDIGFIEICDLDGNLFLVTYENASDGVMQLTGNCTESIRYSKLFKKKFARKIIDLKD